MLDMFKPKKKYQQYKKVIERSGLFDGDYYLRKYRVKIIDMAPIDHFCKYGLNEDLKPNSEFDPVWYRVYYKDVKSDGAFPFIHYIIYGSKESRYQSEEQFKNNLLIKSYYEYLNIHNKIEEIVKIDKIIYNFINEPLVNIVITFTDEYEQIEKCINSILKLSTYKNYKIIGISNNSKEKETFDMIKNLNEKDIRVSFYEHKIPCNALKIKNYAVNNYVKGEHIILLDNNIEIITKDWIECMLKYSQREDVGAVSTKLYTSDKISQHFNAFMGVQFLLERSGKDLLLIDMENISAISTSCLMLKKSIFKDIDGFNEKELISVFNDIDFCMRIKKRGYKNILTPYAKVCYHKSVLKDFNTDLEQVKKFSSEIIYIKKRYGRVLN